MYNSVSDIKNNHEVPKLINDELAHKTQWTPLNKGGANFRVWRMSQETSNELSFKPTTGARVFSLIFLAIGVAILAFAIFRLSSNHIFEPLFFSFIGTIFTFAGVVFFKSISIPIVFDKRNQKFYVGDVNSIKYSCAFSDIAALQIIKEWVKKKKHGGYYSFELNIVLKDAQRLLVIDHGDLEHIRYCAKTVATYVGKDIPIWDASIE